MAENPTDDQEQAPQETKQEEENATSPTDDIVEAPLGDDDITSDIIPLIIDNGGGLLKAGLSTSSTPYCVQSLVGTPKHSRVMLSAPSTEKFFGDLAYKYRGLCKLSYPIQNGIITNWNDIIQLWQYLYSDVLNIKKCDHPVLITETPLNPISNRIRMAQIYLEYFDVPSIYFIPPSVLALLSNITNNSFKSQITHIAHEKHILSLHSSTKTSFF